MREIPIVLAIAAENARVLMLPLLQGAGYSVTCIDQNRLSQTRLPSPVLLIADTTHEGTPVIDTITALLNSHQDLAVIFVLPKRTNAAPLWGNLVRDKQTGFFVCHHIDQALLCFVNTYAGNLEEARCFQTTVDSKKE